MMRPTSRGSTTSLASAGRNILGLKGPAEAHTPSKPDEPAREARESTWREGRGSTLDKGLRDDLMRIFLQLDEDGDGVLNQKESAATKQLVALACGKDERARGVSVKQALGDAQGRADDFMSYVVAVSKQSQIPVPEILKRMNQALMLARRPSKFDESVNELRHALVRNVSNLPDDPLAAIPLWRTATGSSFPLPPGAASGPMICGVAFKAMQYLAARTEDAGIIEAALTAKMAAHRPMFKKLFDQAGEILGISRPERSTLDLFLGKPDSEDFLRVRLKEVSLSSGPEPLLDGIGGFDVGHVEERDVPGDLWAEMRKTKAEVPEHPKLARATSQLTDNDLQNVSLVLTAAPVGRHTFKIRLRLLGNKLVPNYILMVPKLSTKGHCRYSSHKVTMLGKEPIKAAFECGSFLLFNARGDQLSDLVLEHEFLNQRVRVQPKSSAVISEVVPVPELSEEERLNNLACNPRVRSVLESLGLDRKGGERDIAFAMRLGRALRSGYAYDAEATEAELSDLTTMIWEKSRGDCSAFNAGFVYALRAFGIPARVSLGFKYGTAVRDACGAVVAPHAQAEFFADGVGWVPCDATTGVRRFGHEATEVLSFIEWRPANAALEEVNEMHKFIQADYHSFQTLRAQLEGDGWADKPMPPEKFGKMVAEATKQSESSALGQIKQVMHLCKGEPKMPSATRMADLLAAWELGQFRELGTGNGLTESARAGLKIFEGGPFSGRPLRKAEINENMLVPDQIDAVMEHVGAKSTKDWSKFWPFGVFSCNYEFTHQPP